MSVLRKSQYWRREYFLEFLLVGAGAAGRLLGNPKVETALAALALPGKNPRNRIGRSMFSSRKSFNLHGAAPDNDWRRPPDPRKRQN
jgi:hypothetical protein